MMRKRSIQVVLGAVATVVLAATGSTLAQGPDRVPRVMVMPYIAGYEQLLEGAVVEEDAVSLVVTGKRNIDVVGGEYLFALHPAIPNAVKDTIKKNLNQEDGDELTQLTTLVETALDHGHFRAQPVTFVRRGGVEFPSVNFLDYYWHIGGDSLAPPLGAMAQAGPDGDVVILGTFNVRQKDSADDASPWRLTDVPNNARFILTPDSPASDSRVVLAIGWFTK